MRFPPQRQASSHPSVNPMLQSPDAFPTTPTPGQEWVLPRHIPQAKPLTIPVVKTIASATKAYSAEDHLNLCPTLNFYQDSNPETGEWSRLHLENIRQNLERRLQAAKEAGNEHLVKTLEQECQELALSASCLG